MTTLRRGSAPTEHGSRYLQQLCKHWSHKFEVAFDPENGTIQLLAGRIGMTARPRQLEATLAAAAAEDLDRLQGVFEDHINRFAFREAPLAFAWADEDAL